MKHALSHARVLTEDGFVDDHAVVIDGGRIQALVAADHPSLADIATTDLRGGFLLPGFIDCQVNGGGGVLFNNGPNVDGLRRIVAGHRRHGTTSLLPTLISDDIEVMRAGISAVADALAAGVPGIAGIHLEGPYLAAARKGTHDADRFRVPSHEEIELIGSLAGAVTLITVAPECLSAEHMQALLGTGAICAIGHSGASYEQARAALATGVRGVTHLFNAMSPLQGREPGVVGAALLDRESWCGVIVDGHHVHPASLSLALACKPRGKVFLVTDAMPPVGSDDPVFRLYGENIVVRDGVCRNAEGNLAGSALDMASAVRNCVEWLDLSLAEAARMASTYPAQFLGLADRGRIATGCRADLVLLDDALRVRATWIAGDDR